MSGQSSNLESTLSIYPAHIAWPVTYETKLLPSDAEPCLENDFFLPTAFSPNNDGVNDFLQLHGSGIDQISLNIYDRYGAKLYETNNTGFKWYGEKTTNQVLIYFLDLTYTDGEKIFQKGNITITK